MRNHVFAALLGCAILPATIVLLVIFYTQHLRLAPVSVFVKVTHAHTISNIVTIYVRITNQDAIIIRRYPEHSIIEISIEWIGHVHGFTPVARAVADRIPYIL